MEAQGTPLIPIIRRRTREHSNADGYCVNGMWASATVLFSRCADAWKWVSGIPRTCADVFRDTPTFIAQYASRYIHCCASLKSIPQIVIRGVGLARIAVARRGAKLET